MAANPEICDAAQRAWREERRQRLSPETKVLLAWVEAGCTSDAWAVLMAMANEPGAPRWLNRQSLGLDELEHQVLALVLVHLVCIQVNGPFEPDWERPCGFPRHLHGMDFLYHLDLPVPEGVLLLDRALWDEAPLMANGLLEETSEVDNDQADTAGRFMYRTFSIRPSILHALLEPRSCPPESTTP